MDEQQSRRNFLKFSTLAGLGLTINPLSGYTRSDDAQSIYPQKLKKGQERITLLQTTDVHCQLHEHDELFWENDQTVFRKTGG